MSPSDPEFIAAQTTVDRPALAEQLASAAVGSRLAACVQITEATSVYRWEDGVEKDAEQLLTFKTTAQALPGLRRLIEREHPYDERSEERRVGKECRAGGAAGHEKRKGGREQERE